MPGLLCLIFPDLEDTSFVLFFFFFVTFLNLQVEGSFLSAHVWAAADPS